MLDHLHHQHEPRSNCVMLSVRFKIKTPTWKLENENIFFQRPPIPAARHVHHDKKITAEYALNKQPLIK